MKTYTFWFEVTDEESELCGEEFFVEAPTIDDAIATARVYFPVEIELTCHGKVREEFAEMMGYDTY